MRSRIVRPLLSSLNASQETLVLELLYGIAIFIVKLSWLFLLHHLFRTRRVLYRLWALGSVIVAYTIVQLVGAGLHCIPFDALWNPEIPGRCIDINVLFLVCSSLNIATDFAILCLPMPELWRLKVSRRQKCQLTFMFLLGGL